jgi:hypothetical protein
MLHPSPINSAGALTTFQPAFKFEEAGNGGRKRRAETEARNWIGRHYILSRAGQNSGYHEDHQTRPIGYDHDFVILLYQNRN